MDSSIWVAVITGLRQTLALLNNGHSLRRHLDAEIAARDHYSVGGLEYFFEALDGLRFFQLGHYGDGLAILAHQAFSHSDVVGGSYERERNSIHAVLQA